MPGSRRSRTKSSPERAGRLALALLAWGPVCFGAPAISQESDLGRVTGTGQENALRPYEIAGDAIPLSLTGQPGDAGRGRTIVADRQKGLCILCHSGPFPQERFQGDLAPDLRGAGARWSEGQLRLRIVDAGRLNPGTIMPAYYRTSGLKRVAAPWHGKPVLSAAEIEDVVAFLKTLRD